MGEWIMPSELHDRIVAAAYKKRGYTGKEAAQAAAFSNLTARHGIKTHNAIKALHLDELFGSKSGGCVPGAKIEKLPSEFRAVQKWNANRKLGQSVGLEAMAAAMKLADRFGVGIVAVDNAFHYLWGGGYVIDAAKKGYIAYTNCTAALAEVVPVRRQIPDARHEPPLVGLPDLGGDRLPDLHRLGDEHGRDGARPAVRAREQAAPARLRGRRERQETTDATKVKALLPFGAHKGYGLSLIDELVGAFIGGSLPTLRSRWNQGPNDEKRTPSFFFQAIKPEALDCGGFAQKRTQAVNVRAVIEDILGHGNTPGTMLPGQLEHEAFLGARRRAACSSPTPRSPSSTSSPTKRGCASIRRT
jgi:L-2-hydroxycarboxylate dehydrogenase (NAD+)